MERKMFCYQCEQTAGCTACTGNAGVCGKRADTARLQDKLTGALIGLARATEGNEYLITGDTSRLVLEGLFTTVTNVNFNNDTITELIRRVEKERERLVPDCFVCTVSCGKNNNYDMNNLWEADEDVRSLKSLILFGIRGVAAYAYHAAVLGYTDDTINRFFFKALFAIGTGGWFGMGLYQGMPKKIPVVEKDFIFAAISEELGGIYALCILLICLGCFMQFMLIATRMQALFYKLIAFGLGIEYVVQVFLTIGGVTKFIPSTGVTLPLVSYGGSSILSTFILFGVIQGLYVLKRNEEEEEEQQLDEAEG